MSHLDDIELAVNPDPVCPCVLLLDTSASMSGTPISALNDGLRVFQQDVQTDDLARRRVEVAIVTFGNGGVQVVRQFQKVSQFEAPALSAGGNTPMGAAIIEAINLLRERKQALKELGGIYYRPWVFLITDGAPTDNWQAAAERVHNEEQANGLAFFAVGVG